MMVLLRPELESIVTQYSAILPIKIVRLPENVGLGKALNEGMKHCSYDWVFRMDTDDICLPDRFEKQIEFIQKHPNVFCVVDILRSFQKIKKILQVIEKYL